jgi:squalene-associated FAD-dependent desaturase
MSNFITKCAVVAHSRPIMKIAIVGAGWAGMAAAVAATQAGHHATVFEASRAVGGRARALKGTLPDGTEVLLDNGQHILIGAYRDTLAFMRTVGVDPDTALLRLPLTLQFPDGDGLALPRWPAPLDALWGIARARGWSAADKWSLIKTSLAWQRWGFACAAQTAVADLCQGMRPAVFATLIEPLCVSALNTPAAQASGQVFLRVLRDSLFGGSGSSHLLLPRVDLSALFPQVAADWLQARGGVMRLGERVDTLAALEPSAGQTTGQAAGGWLVQGQTFDAVVWATSSSNAAQALAQSAQAAPISIAPALQQWAATAQALQYEAIATVYAYAPGLRLPQPMLALRSSATEPAQFVFDRGQLGGPQGLLALVVSASQGERELLQSQVLTQAQAQLKELLAGRSLQAVQTVVEKRATFACTPALVRPPQHIAEGLVACGDYVEGPYPATLEGAVRSGVAAISAATSAARLAA